MRRVQLLLPLTCQVKPDVSFAFCIFWRSILALREAYENGEVALEKCEDPENFADPQTKYLTYKPWARHLHYTHNFEGDPPPRAEKKKKIAAVLTPKMPWGLTLD